MTSDDRYRLLTYAGDGGVPLPGILVEDRVYPLPSAVDEVGGPAGGDFSSVLSVLRTWEIAAPAIQSAAFAIEQGALSREGFPVAKTILLAPVQYPGALYCAGANYRDHVLEMTGQPPPDKAGREPYFFLKTTAGTIIGPGEKVLLPAFSSQVDWEAEIALIIGRPCRNVLPEEALGHVAGYTILNDLSARDLMKREEGPFGFDWIGQKCFDTAAPMGPWITPREAVADPSGMGIRLWVNGELKQDSNSSQLIFNFEELICYLSRHVTLQPGDVIASGTPAGCGMPKGVFLKPGDEIRIEVEGLGELQNPVGAG